jgi:hypothetical protein
MITLGTIVDWSALGQTALAAIIGGVGVAFAFSIAILGAARLSDPSQELGVASRIVYGALALGGLLGSAAAIVFGLIVMTSG